MKDKLEINERAAQLGLVRAKEGDALVCEGWTLQDIDDTWGPDITTRFLQAVLEHKVAELTEPADSED